MAGGRGTKARWFRPAVSACKICAIQLSRRCCSRSSEPRCAPATDAIIESFRGRLVQTRAGPPGGFHNDGHRTAVWPGSTVSEHSQRQCLARLHAEYVRSVGRLTSSWTVPICAPSLRARAGVLLYGQSGRLAGPAVVM